MLLPPMDRRLQDRYVQLTKAHMHSASPTSAGPTAGMDVPTSFAATQAMWRFLNNPRVTLPALIQPLHQTARQAVQQINQPCVLLVHDWSKLDYRRHRSKRDTVQLTHVQDVGYELTTSLLVSTADGCPLAPMQIHLKTDGVVHSTCESPPAHDVHHLEQVLPTMEASRGWGLSSQIVHVIDREADSVDHYRRWDAAGHRFLVRADDRCVLWGGTERRLEEVADQLALQGAFESVREVEYQGRPARQYVAQTRVTLHRPGKKRVGDQRYVVEGRALDLRLVVAQVRGSAGKVLATWMLLTNMQEQEVSAQTLALWYYWRWRIESFFKLLKGHGQQVEQWQQETGQAIARRLLVATMACVVVWDLQRRQTDQARRMKDLLVRLSGRQMKRRRPHTAPAMLAGLMVLLPMLELIGQSPERLAEIRQLAAETLPFLSTA